MRERARVVLAVALRVLGLEAGALQRIQDAAQMQGRGVGEDVAL